MGIESVKSKRNFYLQNFFYEKTKDFNLFQKIMLVSYLLMTTFFLLSTMFFILTKGFKY